ncbi:MAG: helix-turn-helix domain-containing protein [Chloroflexi bacterium]|nr:helix-turn-helix domain-containing protein [Chloroflexota bacterium]
MAERASDWLKRHRIAAGYKKQQALASALGLSRGAVGNWEANRGAPNASTVPALAAALGVTQAEIVSVFQIQMRGELRTPAPPWAQELMDRVEGLARENANLRRTVERVLAKRHPASP